MATRLELLEAVSARYRAGAPAERSRLPDEFAAVTGHHRKHAIRLLAGLGGRDEADGFAVPARACARACGVEVRDALTQPWEVAGRVCSKRLTMPLRRKGEEALATVLDAAGATMPCRGYSATIWMRDVLPHPGMLPSRGPIASPECSRSIIAVSGSNRP